MVTHGPTPPPLAQHDLDQGIKLIAAASQEPKLPLNTDPALLDSLYYPLRQVPLPSFQYEMLIWQNDKLNVFSESESPLKFTDVSSDAVSRTQPRLKYKRVDPFTILALAVFDNIFIVFTNEISQTSWEIIGAFGLQNAERHLKENSRALVDYDLIESSFAAAQEELSTREQKGGAAGAAAGAAAETTTDKTANDSDDDYWNRYDESSESEAEREPTAEVEQEKSYWDRYSLQTPTLDPGSVREEAVQALVDLAGLYEDCGVTDLNVVIEDIVNLGMGAEAPKQKLPLVALVAHRHAARTMAWIKASSVSYEDEILTAMQKLRLKVAVPE